MGAFTPDLPISALFSISQLNEVVREWSILQFRLDHLPKSIRLLNSWFILSFFLISFCYWMSSSLISALWKEMWIILGYSKLNLRLYCSLIVLHEVFYGEIALVYSYCFIR